MACFLVSMAEAVVVKTVEKVVEKKEKKEGAAERSEVGRVSWSVKLKWLSNMLWGGSFLLLFEHIWHGEVVPWFPFLTAMSNAEDMAEMFHEMATVGVCMAALVTVAWVVMCVASDAIMRRKSDDTVKDTTVTEP